MMNARGITRNTRSDERPGGTKLAIKAIVAGCLAVALLPGTAAVAAPTSGQKGQDKHRDDALVEAFTQTSRATEWAEVDNITLNFDAFHPQSIEVTDDRIYMSSEEVIDREAGVGMAHIFVMDRAGSLLDDIQIVDGERYHPGGFDVQGDDLYVSVAEYKPDSTSNIYKVDLTTSEVTNLFAADDHIGGIVFDEKRNRFIGNTWGSRTFYEWNKKGKLKDTWQNQQHWIDYQDCEYVAESKTLCSGLAGGVGGLDLIDLADDHRLLHQLPVSMTSATSGKLVTQNAVDLDAAVGEDGSTTLSFYVAPDDGAGTTLTTYQTVIPTH